MREQSPEEQEESLCYFYMEAVPYGFCFRIAEGDECGGRATTERNRKRVRRGAALLGVFQCTADLLVFLIRSFRLK